MTETGSPDRPAFDPRHDARFQRGYRPGDGALAPAGRPLVGSPSVAASPDPNAHAVSDPDAAVVDLDALAFDTDAFHDELEHPRSNPFIALLWVMGTVFVAAAVVLQYQAATFAFSNVSYDGNGPLPLEVLVQQLSYSISPSLLTAGLVVLAGLLFWHASAWRSRHRRTNYRRTPAG